MTDLEIGNRDYWIKVVGMLQQNWALISDKDREIVVYFIGDDGGIFDQIQFASLEDALEGLRRNGFSLYSENIKAQEFIALPRNALSFGRHPSGNIYSSGQYWE